MEQGSIERDIHVDASPEVVFEVISRPEHMREWWPDDARFESVAGAPGELVWRNAETGETTTVALAVVEVDPPKRFSFRWCFSDQDPSGHSLLSAATYPIVAHHLVQDASVSTQAMVHTLAGLTIVSVGFSRVYFGVHFPSDVLGGFAAGLGWLGLTSLSHTLVERSEPPAS